MPKITYVSHTGSAQTVDVPTGDSIMEGAVQNSVEGIVGACGGNLQCATCHVYVDDGFLPKLDAIDGDEDAMLGSTAAPRKANSRLSCQIRVRAEHEGCTVHMPDTQ
jgi:ferredoxin, 2Fe-2S